MTIHPIKPKNIFRQNLQAFTERHARHHPRALAAFWLEKAAHERRTIGLGGYVQHHATALRYVHRDVEHARITHPIPA